MNDYRKKQLAKVAYLYYIEGKNQAEISQELGIYRTTVSRMLARAKQEGIVQISIEGLDSSLFQLENYIKDKYGLKSIEIVPSTSKKKALDNQVAQAAAALIHQLLSNQSRVGISWGSTLSRVVAALPFKQLKNTHFYPLAGGPSYINVRYHVNTLVYELARKCQGKASFVNAAIIQQNQELAAGVFASQEFADIKKNWEQLDLAIVGIGGKMKENRQWLDMLTEEDFQQIAESQAVGEVCCRFLNSQGQEIFKDLDQRTVAISLAALKEVKDSVAVAYGAAKAAAILAVLKQHYVNHLVTDEATALALLEEDQDFAFSVN
ncbi:sugar-binding transcriptional regulator [Streptococcus caviae]|uniref:sugar-binding transcriptional regulator n=1 Tax=Streptococcus sp. 'caviae' TaxID=1915004 RepID=UPI00094B9550|nr:sugar-binding transcriptional regulator [Streptococcus sp. 'caviae']OLN83608.1 DNA-binding transcriptional regulator [Streptococcus sp. 'caviae']